MKDSEATVERLIEHAGVSIVGSVDGDGFPNVKAMLPPRIREGAARLFFTTNTSSMRVAQFTRNPKACVYFFDPRRFTGVMLKGTMDVLHDAEVKKAVWRDGDDMYYSAGVTDPDYCVLRFTAETGRYYGRVPLGGL